VNLKVLTEGSAPLVEPAAAPAPAVKA